MPRDRNDPTRDAAWLLDMLNAARAVRTFVEGRTYEQYEQDLLFRSAVERQVEIIGEAARSISEAFKTAHSQIPWRPIMAQRHRLAHEYGEIDDRLIWTVATLHVPALIALIEPLVNPSA
ncbi:MAG TPA: HepT-like ribonuclease domain-containing protein [Tepidisphaeraceae bacterium]|jgi:uncharacterized protein with HEPN domain|nr:HepT-like ribonuclease domain-containing protein [Tepidisphaeraceae bacterium]